MEKDQEKHNPFYIVFSDLEKPFRRWLYRISIDVHQRSAISPLLFVKTSSALRTALTYKTMLS